MTIIRAEAESESARIFNESINKFGTGKNFKITLAFLELKRIEAALEIVENLSKSVNVTYLPSSSNSPASVPSEAEVAGGTGQNFLFKL